MRKLQKHSLLHLGVLVALIGLFGKVAVHIADDLVASTLFEKPHVDQAACLYLPRIVLCIQQYKIKSNRFRKELLYEVTHIDWLNDRVVGLADGERVDIDAVSSFALLLYELELFDLLSATSKSTYIYIYTHDDEVKQTRSIYLMSTLPAAGSVELPSTASPSSDDDDVRLVRKFLGI